MKLCNLKHIIKEEYKVLSEGSYDKMVGILTKQLMDLVKESYINYVKEYGGEEMSWPDQKNYNSYILDEIPPNKHDLDFTIEFYIRRHYVDNDEGIAFDGGAYIENEIIEILITIDPEKEPNNYVNLVGHLKDVLRHEILHLTQIDKSQEEKDRDFDLRFLASIEDNEWTYFILPEEIPAMVHGLHTKAKNNKTSFEYEANKYLSYQLKHGMIKTQEQYNQIMEVWNKYYNKTFKR